MNKNITIKAFGKEYQVTVQQANYQENNKLAVMLVCDNGEPYATVSANMWEKYAMDDLKEDEFYGKHWGECEGLLEQLIEQDVIEKVDPPKSHKSGFVEAFAYRLKNYES